MKTFNLLQTGMTIPQIAVGCMRSNGLTQGELNRYINGALDMGLNFFDHADIYGAGSCECLFGKAVDLKSSLREKLVLQSKCGIVSGVMYDLSKEHILNSVDQILNRLGTEYLDILLLHRPDALVEPEEVAEAFDRLLQAGKVRAFGVSNHTVMQIRLLQSYVKQPLCINQMQLSIAHAPMISQGMEANLMTEGAADRDGGILDYCRLHKITLQAWSPFQYGFFEGVFIGNDKFPELNRLLKEIAEQYQVTPAGIAAAWIMRHPAGIQMIAGTTKLSRLKEIREAADIELTRKEWYELYRAAGHMLP